MLSILAITFPTAAVASITMPTATTQPAFKRVTVATAYPSISDEAQATAEDVKEVAEDSQGTEEDARVLADFAPRTVIADDMAGYSSLDISFPIPTGCAATASTLTCQGTTLDLSAIAIDNAGTPLTASTSVTSSSIKLQAPVTSSVQYPIFATLVASDPAVPEASDDFKETMEWSLGSPNDYDSEADLAEQEAELEPEPGYDPYDGGPVVLEPYVEAQSGRSYVAGPQLASVTAYKAIKRPVKVTVPKSYRYCPKSCKPKSLHDYCTKSPDKFLVRYPSIPAADFRGPCARHDMGIDRIRKQSVSLKTKRDRRYRVDASLKRQMRANCSYTYYQSKFQYERNKCYSTAAAYKVAANLTTKNWNGK